MQEKPRLTLRIQKAWQTSDPMLVLQVALQQPDLPKKAFLIVDTRQASFGMTLATRRPEATTPAAPFINLFRKYCQSLSILDLVEDTESGDLWLCLGGSIPGLWYVRLAKSKPPELSLVSPLNEELVRTGARGSFTKKKPNTDPLPESGLPQFVSCLNAVLNGAKQTLSGEPPAEENPLVVTQGQAEPSRDRAAPRQSQTALPEAQKELTARLRRRLKTLKKTALKAQKAVPSEQSVAEVALAASMLKTHAYRIDPGASALDLTAEETGTTALKMILDPMVSVGQLIDAHFVRVKKLTRARTEGLAYGARIERDLASIDSDLARLGGTALPPADLEDIRVRNKLPSLDGRREARSSPKPGSVKALAGMKTFASPSGAWLSLGRSAAENDTLVKRSKANDWWFHAVGVTGSHVVIPAANTLRQKLPEDLKRAGAILALAHSPLRQDFKGEVYVTRIMHLKKQKNMPEGLWQILRSETLFVSYTKAELDEILGWQKV
jgi:predicted ribosome quality control (RQC) complex YloA/Tae2 family protein